MAFAAVSEGVTPFFVSAAPLEPVPSFPIPVTMEPLEEGRPEYQGEQTHPSASTRDEREAGIRAVGSSRAVGHGLR